MRRTGRAQALLRLRLARFRRKLRSPARADKTALPKVSPLAPREFPRLAPVGGVELASAAAGVRYGGRDDVMLVRLAPGTAVAGVFTRSATRSAAVIDCQAKIGGAAATGAAIMVNSGNANAFTGARGDRAVTEIARAVGDRLALPAERVFTASTGVIGEPLEPGRITAGLDALEAGLEPDGFEGAARAIMTTDTFAKGAGGAIDIDGAPVRIAGIAKGSGMIAPDMATMLVYIFTDATIAQPALQDMLTRLNARSFNCITVDSDTSTSDTLMLAATGRSLAPPIAPGTEAAARFEMALEGVMRDLAHQVVRDGEGATKFVEVQVTGAADDSDARRVAGAVANSPLVKTAIAGEDPNWGRIVMAVGKSGACAERDRLAIRLGDIRVAEAGWVAPDYREADGAAYMRRAEIVIGVDLGLGAGTATMWTCDLTHGYIDINADYRS